ncbi:hypothetical protein ANCCEY_05689 [Ancylostoma ceylanicum]|uniref:PH domain-containing protein n=1 Tax=Ancylostoma ceylanicum TaxID=53326 RepID=A0A0D6LVK4_9BILA|nr:hypothetical protein ANCCEY_05689 [Ancylostoma ceylanicum]
MASLRRRLRKARKRITACYLPMSRRSRKTSTDADVYVSAVENQNPSEVGQSCRGSINLQEARILSDKITNNIVISASSQTFHLKAGNDVDRQKWLSALEYSRHKAIKQAESGEIKNVIKPEFSKNTYGTIPDEDEEAHLGPGESRVSVLQRTHKELLKKLDDLQTAARILEKHGDELIRCVSEPEIDRKTLSERAALLKITTAAVLKAAEEFVDLSDRGSRRMGKVVATEQREKVMLQEQLETLAKQHSSLERAATYTDSNNFNPPLSAYSDMEDEFHDAAEELSLSGSRKSLDVEILHSGLVVRLQNFPRNFFAEKAVIYPTF